MKQKLNTDRENILSHLKSSIDFLDLLANRPSSDDRDDSCRFYYNQYVRVLTPHIGIDSPEETTFNKVTDMVVWVTENIKPLTHRAAIKTPSFLNGDDSHKVKTSAALLEEAKRKRQK